MKKIVINSDNRRFNISSIVVGYLEENKEEVLEFEIPEKYSEYGKKACFSANGQTFAKNFDDIISNKLTITRDISQFKELDMTIAFFKIENEDEIVARTSTLHILIENAIVCDDDIKPDEPKIIILDNLIDEVTKLDVLVTKNEKKREEYYQAIQEKVDNGYFNGATFTPSVDTDGNISWTNDKNLPNPTTQNIKGPKGPKGDTYTLTEKDKQDISSMTVESSESTFNQYYNGKLEDFNSNATNKTTEYNNNAISKVNEFNTNADNKIAEYDLHSQELDNKIIDTRNELERVKNDVLETGTDTDTFVHLEDSAMAEYQELSVDGVCEQESTTGKNLLENTLLTTATTQNGVTATPNSDGSITLNGTATANCYFNIARIDFGTKSFNNYNKFSDDYKASTGSPQEIPSLVYDSSNKYTYINVPSGTSLNNYAVKPMVRLASITDDTYEPYTGGQPSPSPDYPQPISTIENSLKITSCNKNLFDKDNVTSGYRLGSTGDLYREKGYNTSDFVRIKSNTQYFRNVTISQMECVCTYNEKKEFIERLQSGKSITTNNEVKYIRIVSLDENLDIMQLEEGIQTTPYEQHLETQITANLPEGEFIGKINDTYKDTLKVEYNETDGQYHLKLYKSIAKVVLDGSEDWFLQEITSNGKAVFRQKTLFLNSADSSSRGLCNYLYYDNTVYSSSNNKIGFYFNASKILNFIILSTTASTINELKNWLSTHNTEVYYVLAEPYIIDLGICDMPITYNETTNLFTDSDLLPQINAKYYRNFISTVRNLQVNEKALKQELIDINTRLSALESAQTSTTSESEVVE